MYLTPSNPGFQAIDSWSRSRYLGLGTLTTSNPGFQAIDSWSRSSSRYRGLRNLTTSSPGFQAIDSWSRSRYLGLGSLIFFSQISIV